MPTKKLLPGVAALCLISSGVTAQSTHCDKAETQAELRQCEQARYQDADRALNAQWSLVMSKFANEPDVEKALLDAQRAWISFRDLHCKTVGVQQGGGTLQPVVVAGCLADVTDNRVEEFKAFVAAPEDN
ncbi:lysozyme inhibitor LprI family protein [Rhizobium sp. Leaf262]|uniref:lysozyme inhibitor LprI family protein n=1 Tax=Rhizobium sp. Leaf262 TaxID=1736312 RepID=UPI000714E6D9|nr:lysozyme inhibitor LprI family protein [Rhizobium sp. Leaf262]KQO75937.1 hypothetical protein ASF29_12210 [Rhizobium sp. Leaf262]